MSSEARVIKTGIDGLDLTLGGGVRVLERVAGAGGSATLLVRGSAGTGKTILASHIAATLATALEADVAVACVELLPTELAAQLAGFEVTRALLPVRAEGAEAGGGPPRVFAEIVKPRLEVPNDPLGDEILRLLEGITHRGGDPRVLVVDSLSDGYGLGSKVQREAADALARMAARRGLCLVLVEEVQQLRPSPWCFTVDTVIELRLEHLAGSPREERTLTVTKNRFGPSDAGPHELALGGGMLMVLPDPDAWSRARSGGWWSLDVTAPTVGRSWGDKALDELAGKGTLAKFAGSVTTVRASDPLSAMRRASQLGAKGEGIDVRLSLQGDGSAVRGPFQGAPLANGHRLQAMFLKQLRKQDGPIGRVTIGDLAELHGAPHLVRVVAHTAAWLRACGVPVVLYETSPTRLRAQVLESSESGSLDRLTVGPVEGARLEREYQEDVIVEVILRTSVWFAQEKMLLPNNFTLIHDLASGSQTAL